MKKKLKIFLITLVAFLGIAYLLNATSILRSVKSGSGANDPGIKMQQHFFYSSLVKPELFDFICFTGSVPMVGENVLMTFRVCGMPGDIVELRNSALYINGKLMDGSFPVKHFYKLAVKDYSPLKDSLRLNENEFSFDQSDSLFVTLTSAEIGKYKIPAQRISPSGLQTADSVFGPGARNWTADDFGPVTVPAGSYFVLGDNRHAAADSRFRGFIPAASVKGTVVWKM